MRDIDGCCANVVSWCQSFWQCMSCLHLCTRHRVLLHYTVEKIGGKKVAEWLLLLPSLSNSRARLSDSTQQQMNAAMVIPLAIIIGILSQIQFSLISTSLAAGIYPRSYSDDAAVVMVIHGIGSKEQLIDVVDEFNDADEF
ncbi:hypothetical protein MBANPS3_003624 [Mucor bainieri]